MLQAVVNEGTGSRVRTRYGLTMPMGGKQEQRKTIPTDGSWALRHHWFRAFG